MGKSIHIDPLSRRTFRRDRLTAKHACKGKIRYREAKDAIKEARRLRNTNGPEIGPLSVYECEFCKGWHVGKATKMILARLRVVAPAEAG